MFFRNRSRRKWCSVFFLTALFFLIVLMRTVPADSADLKEFFKGKTITFIIPYSPGGGYDTYSRLVAPYIAKHTGAAQAIVKNVPGGGALIGVNTLYRARPDGLTLGIINGTAMSLSQLTRIRGARFDLTKFNLLGRVAAAEEFIYMGKKSPFNTFNALVNAKDKEVKWVCEGKAGSPYYRVVLVSELLKLKKSKIFTGYEGSAEANLSIIRGDADGTVGTYDSRQSHVDSGEFITTMMIGDKRSKKFPDVPTIFETDLDEDDKKLAYFLIGLDQLGRIVGAPPKMNKELSDFLKAALKRASEDPELIAKAEKSRRPIDYASPEEVEKMVRNVLEAPANIKARIDAALKKY